MDKGIVKQEKMKRIQTTCPYCGCGCNIDLILDVQVFDEKLAKSTQQEQNLADREGVGFNLPKILPLICFPDGIS